MERQKMGEESQNPPHIIESQKRQSPQ